MEIKNNTSAYGVTKEDVYASLGKARENAAKHADLKAERDKNLDEKLKPDFKNKRDKVDFSSEALESLAKGHGSKDKQVDWSKHENGATIQQMMKESNAVMENMRSMVEAMLGGKDAIKQGQGYWAMRAGDIDISINIDVSIKFGSSKVSEEDRLKAQEMISEDGYFGVSKTTERIMDFAKALAGSNQSEQMIDLLWGAAKKGFDNVAKMFGGLDKMPQISRDTLDAVNKAFEDWKAGIAPKAETDSTKTDNNNGSGNSTPPVGGGQGNRGNDDEQ